MNTVFMRRLKNYQMYLNSDPDSPPKTVGSSVTLGVAQALLRAFEQSGMVDGPSDAFEVTSELVDYCSGILKSDRRATHLYLISLKALDRRSRGSIFRAAVRMAAQRLAMQNGRCPEVSTAHAMNHWAGAFVMRTEEYFDKHRLKHKLKVKFLIYTGPRAGEYIHGVFSRNFLYVMKSTLGLTLGFKYRHMDNAAHVDSINFARAMVFVESRRTLVVTRVHASTSMVTYNKKLLRSRFRDLYSCPFGAGFDCVQCDAFTDECSRAVRIRNG